MVWDWPIIPGRINVEKKARAVIVRQLKIKAEIKIMVPKGRHRFVPARLPIRGTVEFKNMENEIEVAAQYNSSVELENVTGL